MEEETLLVGVIGTAVAINQPASIIVKSSMGCNCAFLYMEGVDSAS